MAPRHFTVWQIFTLIGLLGTAMTYDWSRMNDNSSNRLHYSTRMVSRNEMDSEQVEREPAKREDGLGILLPAVSARGSRPRPN